MILYYVLLVLTFSLQFCLPNYNLPNGMTHVDSFLVLCPTFTQSNSRNVVDLIHIKD